MRICLVTSSFYPATFYGGPISATWDLSKKISKRDFDVYVSTTNANGNCRLKINTNIFVKQEEDFFVKYYHEEIINRFSLAFIFGIWSDIKKADIVYIQYIFHYTVLFSLLFSFLQNKKVFLCGRGSLSSYGLGYKNKLIKKIWLFVFIRPFVKNITWHASSFLEQKDIKREFPDSIVKIIQDGVDFKSFQHFRSFKKKELLEKFTEKKFEDVSKIFFSMGRLHKIKCFDILIDAFSIFVKVDSNAKLIIAGGDDGEGNILKNQIKNLNLENSVFLIGAIEFDDKNILLNNCDYFTLASQFESFGIVIAEALSCGKPVVVSRNTPWIDIETNKCGILVDNEKESLANALSQIVNINYDSRVIKDYVKSNFDWSVIENKFFNIFK